MCYKAYSLLPHMKTTLASQRRFLFTAAILLGASLTAFGQDAPGTRAGSTELGGFVGASVGVDQARASFGANVAYALKDWLMPYAEYSFFPTFASGTRTGNLPGSTIPVSFTAKNSISDVHGGIHVLVPVAGKRFVPYGALGFGVLHAGDRIESYRFADQPNAQPIEVKVGSSNNFAVNFGGGVRVYVKQNFGFRIEGKAYKPTGLYTNVFYKTTFGLFYQF